MNILPESKVIQIKNLVLAGKGMRPIMKIVGVAKNTVQHYRTEVMIEQHFLGKTIQCACGAPAGHRGWCSVRYQASPARQQFVRCWAGGPRIARLAPVVAVRRVRRAREEVVYVRKTDTLQDRIAALLPRSVMPDVREDLIQDLVVAVLSGEIRLEQIPEKLKSYKAAANKFLYNQFRDIPIDSPINGEDDGLRLIDVLAAPEPYEEAA